MVVFADDGGPTVENGLTHAVLTVSLDLNTLWLFLAAFLVFFMQAGFAWLKQVLPAQRTLPTR
jgi:hypothetical protein